MRSAGATQATIGNLSLTLGPEPVEYPEILPEVSEEKRMITAAEEKAAYEALLFASVA